MSMSCFDVVHVESKVYEQGFFNKRKRFFIGMKIMNNLNKSFVKYNDNF